ncbi:hypothetical protein SASPL_152315 [Salvia splendens]|uniref:Uncharacterized protein n=1 Tax=Salvia splendens TaxID=180675 RepID=A0A8X8W322_SALSN|nr:hypothetical protein SASPL_152315 [Salvia splendens]
MSDSLILDAQVEYLCDDPKDFDCVSNRGMVEGEHCDIPERGLVSTDSILSTEVTKFIDREVAYSHTGNVSNQAIVVTSNISGEEGKLFDDEPPQPSPILQLYILDVSEFESADEQSQARQEVEEVQQQLEIIPKCKMCGKLIAADLKLNGTSAMWKHHAPCLKKQQAGKTQMKLSQEGSGSLISWRFNQTEARIAFCKYIILDDLPFRAVEKEGFKIFVAEICPMF